MLFSLRGHSTCVQDLTLQAGINCSSACSRSSADMTTGSFRDPQRHVFGNGVPHAKRRAHLVMHVLLVNLAVIWVLVNHSGAFDVMSFLHEQDPSLSSSRVTVSCSTSPSLLVRTCSCSTVNEGPYDFAYVMMLLQPSSHASHGGGGGAENSYVLKISSTKNEALSKIFRDHEQHFSN